MRITQDIRDYAAKQGVTDDDTIAAGMAAKAREFRERGAELYLPPAAGDTGA